MAKALEPTALGAPSAGFAAHTFKANVGMVPFTEIMIEFMMICMYFYDMWCVDFRYDTYDI